MAPLTAIVEVPAGQTNTVEYRLILRVTNQSDSPVSILNPDMGLPAPATKWPWSNETYRTSILMSFGYLSISVTDETSKELPQQVIQTWATPVLRPKIELGRGESFELPVPIGSFYQLESGRTYLVVLEYGDQALKVLTRTSFTAP
jgi:hypothetical protein